MQINSTSASPGQSTPSTTPCRPACGLTKRMDNYVNNYDTGFERVAKLRAKILAKAGHTHEFDRALVLPEQYRSRGLRALIHLAKYTEEIAEGIADI